MIQVAEIEKIKSTLASIGYSPGMIRERFLSVNRQEVVLGAYSSSIKDARTSCIAFFDSNHDPFNSLKSSLFDGFAHAFFKKGKEYQWWVQGPSPCLSKTVKLDHIGDLFQENRELFLPASVYRAKNRAPYERTYQVDLIDLGIMEIVSAEIGKKLGSTVEHILDTLSKSLSLSKPTDDQSHWLTLVATRMIATKILKDKGLPEFYAVGDADPLTWVNAVSRHYGAEKITNCPGKSGEQTLGAISQVASYLSSISSMANTTTESLADLYEGSLVNKRTRKILGIHSTPSYLIEYIIWRLEKWITAIDVEERVVLEPTCGHGGFLTAALRVLADNLPPYIDRHKYLRDRIIGIEIDSFALEVARLSLTLADAPNANGWDLRNADVFSDESLDSAAKVSNIILGNPPFEKFSNGDRVGRKLYVYKSTEVFWRVIKNIPFNGVIGMVMPLSFLSERGGRGVRKFLVENFQVEEILILPDKVFLEAQWEAVVILAKKSGSATSVMKVKRVTDIGSFKRSFVPCCEEEFTVQDVKQNDYSFLFPTPPNLWQKITTEVRLASILCEPIGRGIDFKEGEGARISQTAKEGWEHGYHKAAKLSIFSPPPLTWMNTSRIRGFRKSKSKGTPQLLVNAVRSSRNAWRIKGFMDQEGLCFTTNFLALRPRNPDDLKFLWALVNSPFCNAYMFCHCPVKHNRAEVLANMPVPELDSVRKEELYELINRAMTRMTKPVLSSDEDVCSLMKRIDAIILDAYQLSPRVEAEILNFFHNTARGGVDFGHYDYFPDSFHGKIRLSEYLENQKRERMPSQVPELLLEALDNVAGAD